VIDMADIKPPLSSQICKEAIYYWGKENQLDMCVEEFSEGIKALMKYRRYKHTEQWRLHCIEEAADISIMLEQMVMMLSSDEEFQKVRAYKLNRLKQMIESKMPKQTCENSRNEEIDFL